MSNDILSIIQLQNPEDITHRELAEFESLIEDSILKLRKLQQLHNNLTGKDYTPPIRL